MPFDNREDYTWEYTYESKVKTFKLGDKILWEDGEYISDITAEVFNHGHPYVGDVSANANLAYDLEIEKYVGDYTTKLHTIAEPYGWSMMLNYEILPGYVEEKESLMRKYSYVLLALVDNVDYITLRAYIQAAAAFKPGRNCSAQFHTSRTGCATEYASVIIRQHTAHGFGKG